MGGASIWHWIIVGAIVLLLFGRGKISEMMGDVAKGIKAFKKGMSDDDTTTTTTTTTPAGTETVRTLEHQQGHAHSGSPVASAPGAGERKLG